MGKEADYLVSYHFERGFGWAVAELVGGRIDVSPILSGEFRFDEADAAFVLAKDRTKVMKVHLTPA
jgi:L-idonate 5-dehydrogenase